MNAKSRRVNDDKSELKGVLDSFRGSFLYVGFFSLFINLLMLVPPFYMLQVYDRVMASRSLETLLMITLIVVWLFITMGLLEYARSRMLVRIGSQLDDRLNSRLYSAMTKMALRQPGRASSQPLNDLTSMRQFMTGNGPFAFFDAPWIPIYFAILFVFHPMFGVFALFAAAILIGLAIMNEVSTRDLMKDANNRNIQSTSAMSAQLRNAEVLHAMGMESAMREHWLRQHLAFLQAQSDASDKAGIWMNFSKTLRIMFQSLMLGLGGYLAINNEITAGMIIAGSILMGRALGPIDQMIGAWKQFNSARMAYARLEELLQGIPDNDRRMSLPAPKGDLRVESVTLIPPGSQQPILRSVSFDIAPGDALLVLGPSASGKSSLLRALLGIWPLAAGKVRLDGAEIGHWNRDELGSHIGYLPQDVELFEGTIAQNIARFNKIESEKVMDAARMAGVDEMIRRLPEGYDTLIGPGGATLSGGQRQRVGLARAIYGKPSVVILDEPNASLDDAGELALVNACKQLKSQGTTLILVTHRRSILEIADKVLLLVEGQVRLFGERDNVLQQLAAQNQQAVAAAQARSQQQPRVAVVSSITAGSKG
ncbi:type I secretion system permease/ATPase [Thiothrix subterranea]|uniref:Type I secretion system permease/ATPase n=1 Tax=Thiothrix subterranea TaxID=2735563 RepID=A0AA51QYS9_9GAMM|nr:type I secretion system permease/ATPase [Thiothrix subterranea]MDQ5767565.1 type I secretion system permease/ATPase [Thiothrix subterranea]QQZ29909.1 type I secretion system permease/ATPase [Thiothrix subterranea]WML88553.1 type I secretion system permease/ATPase [Thiothrix subterranea]